MQHKNEAAPMSKARGIGRLRNCLRSASGRPLPQPKGMGFAANNYQKNYFDSFQIMLQNGIQKLFQKCSVTLRLFLYRFDIKPLTLPSKNKNNIFIFTEIINCGKIGKIAIESFVRFHPNAQLCVFGMKDDLAWIHPSKKLSLIDISDHKIIVQGFRSGHLGTAMLWAKLIKERKDRYIIHFDSDVIFRHEALSDITKPLNQGFDLVGYIRNYKHNPNNRTDVQHLPDLTQTAFFGFNREKIDSFSLPNLTKMCQGSYNPAGHPIIDFFDPVMFNILKNRGRIHHLSAKNYGGCDYLGQRAKNDYPELNNLIDFGHKYIHFSAVGSGMNFYEHEREISGVPESYKSYAMGKYALFCKIFYNEDINYPFDPVLFRKFNKINLEPSDDKK